MSACPAGTSDRSGGGVDSMVAMEPRAVTFTPSPNEHTHLQNQGTVLKNVFSHFGSHLLHAEYN